MEAPSACLSDKLGPSPLSCLLSAQVTSDSGADPSSGGIEGVLLSPAFIQGMREAQESHFCPSSLGADTRPVGSSTFPPLGSLNGFPPAWIWGG